MAHSWPTVAASFTQADFGLRSAEQQVNGRHLGGAPCAPFARSGTECRTLPSMPIPATPEERYAEALEEAWVCAERTRKLLNENNISTAIVWASAAQAWATIAATASLQRTPG